MNKNNENTGVGKSFQNISKELLAKHYHKEFIPEIAINIGNPPKLRKFDLVSEDMSIVVECKCYNWTQGNNNPSAKMSTLNEAVLYFKLLDDICEKVIVMKKSIHPNRDETLAEYYFRTYRFVLDGITLLEVDTDTQTINAIKE